LVPYCSPLSRPDLAGVLLGIALGERRRLALAGPPRLLELLAQPGVLGQQTLVLCAQSRIAPIAANATQTLAPTPRAP
jgi:hypothetical protein